MPFDDAVARIRAFGRLRACAAPARPRPSGSWATALRLTGIRQPDALWVARLALSRPVPDQPPAPLYLRAPDAKLPGRATR